MYDEDEDAEGGGGIGPTWHMEDITGGSVFNETYQVASASNLPPNLRSTVEYGNKIVMPASALDALSRLNIMYPMMFRVASDDAGPTRSTFCGVLEFSASEGLVYLPPWMLKTLKIRAGDLVQLSNVALSVGTFIKIQPQSVDFLDITDPRAVLEHSLRNFATLTVGDRVAINYNNKIYELLVQQVKPDDGRGGISVLETDLQVEFATPLGYEEPKRSSAVAASGARSGEKSIASSLDLNAAASQLSTSATNSSVPSFAPFSGTVNRLSSKAKTLARTEADGVDSMITGSASTSSLQSPLGASKDPIPINLPKGTLFFGTSTAGSSKKSTDTTEVKDNGGKGSPTDAGTSKFAAFSGKANKLQ